jgi:hypothetical protein
MRGDYLAVTSAEADGLSRPSDYNSRPRAAGILVGAAFHSIRVRETYADSIHGETQ